MTDLAEAFEDRSLLLLGCGKMGFAMLDGWLAAGAPPERIAIIDPAPSDALAALATERGLRLNAAPTAPPSVVVLAVKPQMMDAALPQIVEHMADAVAFSIAAGTPIARFERAFGAGARVVRAMPNTPAAVGAGIAALYANDAATAKDRALSETLIRSVGDAVWLDSEAQMDAVTGVSGSGPAYVFHMIEALAAAGEAEGLAPGLAMRLARGTVCGAGALAAQSTESAEQLRINVTSPGGTTAAGLEPLMAGLPDLMRATVKAAADRSRVLAK